MASVYVTSVSLEKTVPYKDVQAIATATETATTSQENANVTTDSKEKCAKIKSVKIIVRDMVDVRITVSACAISSTSAKIVAKKFVQMIVTVKKNFNF